MAGVRGEGAPAPLGQDWRPVHRGASLGGKPSTGCKRDKCFMTLMTRLPAIDFKWLSWRRRQPERSELEREGPTQSGAPVARRGLNRSTTRPLESARRNEEEEEEKLVE